VKRDMVPVTELCYFGIPVLVIVVLLAAQGDGGDDARARFAISCVLVVSLLGVIAAIAGKMYTLKGDMKLVTARGACDVQDQDTEESVMRELYGMASYPSIRTSWPMASFYSLLGALLASCFVGKRFLLNVFVIFLVTYATVGSVQGFYFSHSRAEMQANLDNLYCRYHKVRALGGGALQSIFALDSSQSQVD
jgi:hypothetical protein